MPRDCINLYCPMTSAGYCSRCDGSSYREVGAIIQEIKPSGEIVFQKVTRSCQCTAIHNPCPINNY